MTKIYTCTGDTGTTSLVGGKRVSKTHDRLEAYGTVDELSSHLGLLAARIADMPEHAFLCHTQQTLFDVSAWLATESESTYKPAPLRPEIVGEVEREIDTLQESLPQLRTFILPGGCAASAQAHVCRTVCRRAERRIIALSETCDVSKTLLCYINRVSDYLFVLARKINLHHGVAEVLKK